MILFERVGPGSEYHCAHGDDELQIFTVLDMKPVDYMTFLFAVGEGMAMRYTDYVIPSGSGTRIVVYASPVFSIETGKDLPEEALETMAAEIAAGYREALERMALMADEAMASLSTV